MDLEEQRIYRHDPLLAAGPTVPDPCNDLGPSKLFFGGAQAF